MAQLVALVSGVVLGGVAEVVGSNLARGKIFTASIGSVDSLYLSIYIYIYGTPLTFAKNKCLKALYPQNITLNCPKLTIFKLKNKEKDRSQRTVEGYTPIFCQIYQSNIYNR